MNALPREHLLQDWAMARERGIAYAEALGIPPANRPTAVDDAIDRALTDTTWAPDDDATSRVLDELRRAAPLPDPLPAGVAGSTPPLTRSSMGRPVQRDASLRQRVRERRRAWLWTALAVRRRLLLIALVVVPSSIASRFMLDVFPHQGRTWIEMVIVLFFAALFAWISVGFWTALLGLFTMLGKKARFAVTALDPDDDAPLAPGARTAVCMPICEEPVERVFAGLRAIRASLARTGQLGAFDFFIASDTADPALAMAEEEAWRRWCEEDDGFGRIFYRRRRVRLERKSGNVADWCRRFGRRYRYLVMLDADSLMAGETIVRLVRMMERLPETGLIQTAPATVNRHSLFARVQQFAGALYGPMFAAGLHYWQLGESQYWGHNTILRVAPFMEHCALPRLPGRPPLGGEILSHDFVEAALLGRAGWQIWLAYDLGGSWEEPPSTLLEEMKRDRRWCQGNLQHTRILFTDGLFGAHRWLFLNGVLSYVSALLWFLFLVFSTAEAIWNVLVEPDYFPDGASLFPQWPVWRPDWALSLLAITAVILFLPKVLSVVVVAIRGEASRFGGLARLVASVVLEIVWSTLFAPIRMVFHTRFVLANLLGRTVAWKSNQREDAATSWGEALRHHGADTIVASVWGVGLYLLNPDYFWWITPIIGALVLSVPLSVIASRRSFGEQARRLGLFLIPEEVAPPPEIRELHTFEGSEATATTTLTARAPADGFVRLVVDPTANALRRRLARGPRRLRPSIVARRREMIARALSRGPSALTARERKLLSYDPQSLADLHRGVWRLRDRQGAAAWSLPDAP